VKGLKADTENVTWGMLSQEKAVFTTDVNSFTGAFGKNCFFRHGDSSLFILEEQ
jgi:hypothetical protein